MRKSLSLALAILFIAVAVNAFADTSKLYGKWGLTGSFAGQSLAMPVDFEVGYDSTRAVRMDLNNSYDANGNLQNYIYIPQEFQDHTTYRLNRIDLMGQLWNTAFRMDDNVFRGTALGYTYNGPYPVYQNYLQVTMAFADSNYSHAEINATIYHYANQSYYSGVGYLDRLPN